jgi:hypothetical protein
MIWLPRQDLPVNLVRFRQAARLMMLPRNLDRLLDRDWVHECKLSRVGIAKSLKAEENARIWKFYSHMYDYQHSPRRLALRLATVAASSVEYKNENILQHYSHPDSGGLHRMGSANRDGRSLR